MQDGDHSEDIAQLWETEKIIGPGVSYRMHVISPSGRTDPHTRTETTGTDTGFVRFSHWQITYIVELWRRRIEKSY